MPGLNTNAGVVKRSQGRECLREEPRLHLFRNLQLLCCAPFRFQLFGNLAALLLDLPAHLVRADQFKGVSIHVHEAGKGPAPELRLWRMVKMHSTAAPQFKRGVDIFCDETDLGWPTDELVVFRTTLGSNQCKDRTAVRRCNCNPAAKFETTVRNHAEPELIHVEVEASIVIANENIGLENTKIRTPLTRVKGGGVLYPPHRGAARLGNFGVRAQVRLLEALELRRSTSGSPRHPTSVVDLFRSLRA